jgi:O-antigen/teichoic acid export membrane protein
LKPAGRIAEWGAKALSLLTFKAFDPQSEGGRSKERYRRAGLATLAAFGARGIQILTSLITVPLTLHYLGVERYGMWMTISATIAMFSFADLGIGNGLLNAISESHGRGDRESAAKYVSSAFFTLIGIAVAIGVAFAVGYPLVPWARVFNVSSALAASEAGPAVAVFVGSFLIAMPLGVVQRVRMGYQEGFIDSIWAAGGSVCAFVAVLLAVRLNAPLPWLVASMAAAPALVQVVNAGILFGRRYPWLKPRITRIDKAAASRVMRTGGYFFILQIAGAVAYQSDSIILAQLLGPEAVTQYAIPMKLFSLTPMILGFAYAALWPAYGEAIARGDVEWARVTLKRSLIVGLSIAVPISALIVVAGQPVIKWWVGPAVVPTYLVLVAMGLWAAMGAINGSIASFLNGAGILRFQAVTAILMMVANVVFSVLLTRVLGVSGVVWGSVLSQTVFILLPTWVYIAYLFRRGTFARGVG